MGRSADRFERRGAGQADHDDATVISRGEQPAGSWSGSATGSLLGGPTTTTEIGRLLEGSMLGPYRLDRFIGGGGMGAVFRALDTTLDRIVAVKVLAGRQADDEEMLKRFRNEAQSAARLDHENIGRVHAVGSEDGWHYIVFEFIEGTNLRDLIREQGPFDLARAVDVSIQVADALEHASEREVVHRDIKPSNIVITPTGRARIVDMGLARLHHLADDRDLTVSGMTLGTFDYISPEQARDPRAADVRSDLYSLGCTIFFMLAGRPPFADGTMVQKLLQHQQAEPPALDHVRGDVPRQFAEIVERLMAKDPLDRYQRPAVLVADLVAFADDHALVLASPRPSQPTAMIPFRPTTNRLPWLLPLAGLLLLVSALWLRSTLDRRWLATAEPATPAPGLAAGTAVVRLVSGMPGAGEVSSMGEAIRLVADGGVIEVAHDGPRQEPPVSLGGKRVTLRGVAGVRPAIEFSGLGRLGPDDRRLACDIGDGELVLRGVDVRLAGDEPVEAAALFGIRSGRLVCEDVILRMPGDASVAADEAVESPAAFIVLSDTGSGTAVGGRVALENTRAAGDAIFIDAEASGPGAMLLTWSGGAFVSPRRLLVVEGGREGGLDMECDFEDVVVACGEGIVLLRDSAARPVAARLRVRAGTSRFMVRAADGPFVEQVGGGVPDAYGTGCVWLDEQSRYEGGGVFRRIDAAAERVDIGFRDVVPQLVHEPAGTRWPDPAKWMD